MLKRPTSGAPDSNVVQMYSQIEDNHVGEIRDFLKTCAPQGGNRSQADYDLLARVIYHHWNARLLEYLRDEGMTLDAHKDTASADIRALARLVSFGQMSPEKG